MPSVLFLYADIISELLVPLEFEIKYKLTPTLTYGCQATSQERELLSLPARLGGLSTANPVKSAQQEYNYSQLSTKLLTANIINQVRDIIKLTLSKPKYEFLDVDNKI